MPTETISTIAATSSPTTPDYTSLQAWEDACPSNLVTADEVWIGECLNQGEFGGGATNRISISGITVDSTRYVHLRCAAGHSFRDDPNVRSNPLRYDSSKGVGITANVAYSTAINVAINYCRFTGLQVDANQGSINFPNGGAVSSCLIDSCIIDANGTSGQGNNEFSGTMINCLIIQRGSNNGAISQSSGTAYHGCTIARVGSLSGFGVVSYGGNSLTVRNCALLGFITTLGNSTTGTRSHNASTGHSNNSAGTSSHFHIDKRRQHVSDDDWRPLPSSKLARNGFYDSTNLPVDITGKARSQGATTIGCWELDSNTRPRSRPLHSRRVGVKR